MTSDDVGELDSISYELEEASEDLRVALYYTKKEQQTDIVNKVLVTVQEIEEKLCKILGI